MLKFAIFGTGWMANIFAQELHAHTQTKIVGVASADRDRAEAFAKKYEIPIATDSYEALASEPSVDVVYVATTNNRHVDNIRVCLDAEKPVLAEKPITLTTSDLESLIAHAERNHVFLMEAMWMRCFPFYRELEKQLAPIGPINKLYATFRVDRPFNSGHRVYNPNLGGGALVDIGIYPVHLLHRLWGLKGANVSSKIKFSKTGTDSEGRFEFRYNDGREAMLEYSLLGHHPHVAVFSGERGDIRVDDFFHPSKITVKTLSGPPQTTTFSYPVMGYHYEIDHVIQCLEENRMESNLVPLSMSMEITEWMAKMLDSAPKCTN